MILKAFKEKSIRKHINKLLKVREVAVKSNKVTSVGIILNSSEFTDGESFKSYFKSLGVQLPRIKVIHFVDKEENDDHLWGTYYTKKDFNWKGKIHNIELQTFIDYPFDVLIAYFEHDDLELQMVTAASKANFKVGVADYDQRLFDLIIDTKLHHQTIFKEELTKYLRVLNKL